MGRQLFFSGLRETETLDEIGALIKKSTVLTAAVKKNPALVLSLVNAAQSVAGEKELTKTMVMTLVKSDANLVQAAKSDANFLGEFQKFLAAAMKLKPGAEPTKTVVVATNGENGDESEEKTEEDAAAELNLQILALINEIPYAHPGDIITSEHHNSLRRAIKALAALIDDVDTTSIHTFAPNFMPTAIHKSEEDNQEDWILLYNSAVVQGLGHPGGAGSIVKGGLIVRLPDDVLIKSMIVRGRRLQEEADDPKSFKITLFRFEPDKSKPKPVPLITFDLTEATGIFKKTESPESSVRVDNAKYIYFVLAVWEDEDDSAGFEIRPIQIVCER